MTETLKAVKERNLEVDWCDGKAFGTSANLWAKER
jgi:hypothetical protein